MGTILTRYFLEDSAIVVGMGFLKDETLLAVFSNGKWVRINCYTGNNEPYQITPKDDFQSDKIIAAKTFEFGLVYMTESLKIYLYENVTDTKKTRIYSNDSQLISIDTATDFAVLPSCYSARNKTEVFVPATNG